MFYSLFIGGPGHGGGSHCVYGGRYVNVLCFTACLLGALAMAVALTVSMVESKSILYLSTEVTSTLIGPMLGLMISAMLIPRIKSKVYTFEV